MPNNNINFQINYQKGDTSALDSLRKELMELKSLASNLDFNLDEHEIQSFIGSITTLEKSLNKAFDVNLNTINIQKFQQLLAQSGANLSTIRQGLSLAGAAGDQAFLHLTSQLVKFNTATKQTNKFLDSIANSFFNTIKYTAFNTILNNISGTVQKATGYIKSLDTSLNDIRIVTGKSADEMERFAEEANNAAKQLAVTTSDYTEGSLIYYQQGLDDETVKTLTDITAMTSNVTGQSMEEVSEQLTAVWNGYQVANQAAKEGMQVYQEYVDKMAAVGATTASDLQELATAMSKVASAASSMGVGFDDLAAQIATIVSVTRQAPESVGTALKTVYARLGDLKVDGVDEFGTKLGEVSTQLQTMGINILDTNGDMRDMSAVMTEVAKKWDTWTSAQKQAAAVAMAGKRQYNNLVALFDNWDMYGEALETSMNAAGTLEQQQEIALDSLANKMDILRATSEDFYDSLLDETSIKNLVEGLTKIVQLLADFADATGGLNTLLPVLASTALTVFNQQIANGLSTVIINMRTVKSEAEMAKQNAEQLRAIFHDSSLYVQTGDSNTEQARIEGLRQLESIYSRLSQYQSLMTQEEKEQANHIINLTEQAGRLGIKLEEEKNNWIKIVNSSENLSRLYKNNISDASKLAQMASEFKKLSEDISKTRTLQFTDDTLDDEAREAIEGAFSGDVQKIILEEFDKATGNAKQKIQTVIDKLKELGSSSNEINKLTSGMENARSSAQALGNVLEQNLSIKQKIADITTLIGSVGQLASSIRMITNLFDTIFDKDADPIDKITQSLIVLGTTVPLVLSSLSKMAGAFNNIAKAKETNLAVTRLLTLAEGELTVGMTTEQIVQVLVNKGQSEETALIYANIIAKKLEEKETEKQIGLQLVLNKLKAVGASTTTLVIAALAALVTVIIAVIKYQQKQLENQIKLNKEQIERVNTIQEEVDANKKLVDSYEDLYRQYEKGEDVKNSLYEKTLEIAKAYDIEGAQVLALADKYDILREKIQEARQKELEETAIPETESEVGAASGNVLNIARQGRGHLIGNDYTIDLGGGFAPEDESKAMNALYNNSSFYRESGELITLDANDPKQLIELYDQLSASFSEMNQTMGDSEKQHSELYQHISEWLGRMKESVEEYKNAVAQLNNYKIEDAFLNQKDEKTGKIKELNSETTAEEIQNMINSVRESVDIPEEEVDEYIDKYLSGISEIASEYEKLKLADKISKDTKQGIDDVLNQIKNFNAEQLAFLNVHLNTALLDENLEQWLNDNKQYINFIGAQGSKRNFEDILNNYDEKKGISEEQVDNIYNDNIMSSFMNPSKEEFQTLDKGDQLDQIAQAWIKNTQYVVKYRDEVTAAITAELTGYEEIVKANENKWEASRSQLDEMFNNDTYRDQQEELTNLIQKLASNEEELTENEKHKLEVFADFNNVGMEQLKWLGESINEQEDYAEAITDANERLAEAKEATLDYKGQANALKQAISGLSASLDDIQSAYKSLTSITDNYNKTKQFTIDDIQTLIAMDDQYVTALELEGNHLTFNEELFKQLTLAKLEKLKTDILEEAQAKLNAIAEEEVAQASLDAAKGQTAAALATEQAKNAASDAIPTLKDLANTLEDIGNKFGFDSVQSKEAEEVYKATENRLKFINELGKNVGKGGASLKTAMGAGSKSSSSSKDKDKELKKLEEEFDRYWEIHKALDQINRDLKRMDKDQENLYGKELIRSLKQENELLANQSQLYEQLYAAQEQEAAELRGTLTNSGVVFDASGAVLNYAEATAAALKEYNDAITAYNAGKLDDAALKIHEQKFEQFKKDLERYDTLFYTEMQDTLDKIDDLRRQTLANNLKAWEVEIQLKLDFKELEREWNDFIKEVNDDFKSVFKDLRVDLKSMLTDAKTYIGDEGTINTIIGAVHDTTAEIDKMMGGGSSDMYESVSQAQEKLKELNEELLDSATALHDLWEEAWDNYLEGIDQVADAFDDLIERFERINDELEFQEQIIELLYGDEAYALMNKLYEGQERNTAVQLQSLKTQVDMWKDLFYTSGATLDNQTSWTEDQQKYYEQWMEAQSALNDLVIDYIELLKKDYLNTVSSVLQELEKYVTGSSLDDLNTQWERISDNADKYYDSVESAYYIQTLANKIDQSIADADGLKAQQKLMALREKEIDYLREKENLIEYDIKAAELRYQIALKEIALEDAQNNKTGMKLTRNEQGNWSYQYVADETDVATKQQELLDAYNNLYQLASDAYEANLEALQELQEKYLESAKAIYEDDTLTEEERQAKLLELREWYLEQYRLLSEENQLYRDDLASSGAALLLEIYEQDQEAYESMTEHERELVDALINANIDDYMELEDRLKDNYQEIGDKAKDVMTETRLDWTSGAQTIADLWNKDGGWSVKTQVVKAYDAIQEANRKYKEAVDWCAAAVERNFGEEGIVGAIQAAEYETDSLRDKTVEMVNTAKPYLSELRDYVDQIGAAWKSVQDQIMAAISLIDEYLRKVGEANEAQARAAEIAYQEATKTTPSSTNGNSNRSGYTGSKENRYSLQDDPYGVSGNIGVLDKDTGRYVAITRDEYKNKLKSTYAGNLDTNGLATGGYTGEWGDTSGKLAFLHEKELVLNADDTKNFLSGINTIRDLSSSVGGSIQDAILKAVANTALSLGSIKANGVMGNIANNNSSTDNVFNITAEFPNANSVDDIREAILSLPNIASQYANSTLK